VSAQFFDGIELAFELLLAQELMDLRMAGATDSDQLAHRGTIELALIPFVGVPGARDEVMSGETFLPLTDRAASLHRAASMREFAFSNQVLREGKEFVGNLRMTRSPTR
jgi:hypothetical protein